MGEDIGEEIDHLEERKLALEQRVVRVEDGPREGGHVGFPDGRLPGHVRTMPDEVGGWLLKAIA